MIAGTTISVPPHSASLRLYRRKQGEGCWFVTKSLEPKRPVLAEGLAEGICSAFCAYADQEKIHIGSFVVMPDHWHALLATRRGKSISSVMQAINHWISRQTCEALRRFECEWQEGFYETRIRSLKQFQFVRNYIEGNPVKAGLISKASEWRWSTANQKWRHHVANPWPMRFEND